MGRKAGLAAGLVAICCAAALVYTSSSRSDVLFVWTPHEGKLTALLNNAKPMHSAKARVQQLAITDDPAVMESSRHDSSSEESDSSWAKQMLRTGGSYAEEKGRTNLVTPGYSNTHSGYTSSIPESHGGQGVYAFASQISHDHTSREEKQTGAAQKEELAQTDQPVSAAIPESQGGQGVYSFGNMISHDKTSREGKQTGAARTEELAQSDQPLSVREALLADRTTASQASAKQVAKRGTTPDVREEPARATTKAWEWAHDPQKGTRSARASRVPTGESAAVSESEDTHEQKAWSWATTAFSPHSAKKILTPGCTTQFTCFTSAKVQILTPSRADRSKASACAGAAEKPC